MGISPFPSNKDHFERADIIYVPRNRNTQEDALSKLAAAGNQDKQRPVIVL